MLKFESLMAVAAVRPTILLTVTAAQLKCSNSNGVPPQPSNTNPIAHLSLSKPTYIVQTESNVRKMKRKTPDPPCIICKGSGRIGCHDCRGKGRVNYTDHQMLPKGEWPKWCKSCGGTGLDYCSRCLGTGAYRDVMGFQFMKSDMAKCQDHSYQGRRNSERQTADDLFLSEGIDPDKKPS